MGKILRMIKPLYLLVAWGRCKYPENSNEGDCYVHVEVKNHRLLPRPFKVHLTAYFQNTTGKQEETFTGIAKGGFKITSKNFKFTSKNYLSTGQVVVTDLIGKRAYGRTRVKFS